jgi:hypothetical protein
MCQGWHPTFKASTPPFTGLASRDAPGPLAHIAAGCLRQSSTAVNRRLSFKMLVPALAQITRDMHVWTRQRRCETWTCVQFTCHVGASLPLCTARNLCLLMMDSMICDVCFCFCLLLDCLGLVNPGVAGSAVQACWAGWGGPGASSEQSSGRPAAAAHIQVGSWCMGIDD